MWRVEVKNKEGIFDAAGEGVRRSIIDLGIRSVSQVQVTNVFLIDGRVAEPGIRTICQQLLIDPITQEYSYFSCGDTLRSRHSKDFHAVEIAYNPGVMDPVEESTMKGINDLGINGIIGVRTAKKYNIYGAVSEMELTRIVTKALSNKLIQHVVKDAGSCQRPEVAHRDLREVIRVEILGASGTQLKKISGEGQLFLTLQEMKGIQRYFKKIGRNPSDCELETIAQTWSEHCSHKTFRGTIRYRSRVGGAAKTVIIKDLLAATIMRATREIGKPWCVSVFKDNAGVIRFDNESDVCFKVETHNHPSMLEPFGGANTGVGGVIRDILGTGLGAKPICTTDVFCFAPPDVPVSHVPAGTLHPKRIMKGVVSGVADYGNKMGIPTVNGAIIFDERFIGNPLVYCGSVGIMPKNKAHKRVRKGDRIVVIGGRTGRDGIHGATFSSGGLTHESETISSDAVQIGNPIQEKKVLDALLRARDRNLYSAITDCGAGGFSSAIGEMGRQLGCRVDLDKAPLKYEGLSYMEIWISESQERMVLSVGKDTLAALLELFRAEDVEAAVIGEFTGSERLELFYHGQQVCDLDMEYLHEGIPPVTKDALWAQPKLAEPRFRCPKDLTRKLHAVLSHYNVCSKEWVIRQYDHEVQGASIIKPLVGKVCDGPSDASVIKPKTNSNKGIALSNGINARFGMIDPYWMAASCIDEAIRQIVAVGGRHDAIAILDNFCWGNPDKPDRLGSLVRAAQGCYKTAVGFGTPFISGKDSLNNEFTVRGKSIAIPGTILISALGIIDDVRKTVTMDMKAPGNALYVIGQTAAELGGSVYYDTCGALGSSVPKVDTKRAVDIFRAVAQAIRTGYVVSAHDCSEGGLGVACAEMAFAGGYGATLFLAEVPFLGAAARNDTLLFSESNSRFVLEVPRRFQKSFERVVSGLRWGCIGCVAPTKELTIYGLDGKICVGGDIDSFKESWQKPLRW